MKYFYKLNCFLYRREVQRVKDADQERALACYQRQKDTVYKLAWTYCGDKCRAEDIFQEVFYKYLIYNPKFKSPEHEKVWFIRTTINLPL